MCTKWIGFTIKAFMLTLLSLILFGCGGGGSNNSAPALRTVTGVVSDSATGQPFANASVTAFAVDAAGNVATTPLSATVQSDSQGNFVLSVPAGYTGVIMLKATENGTTVIRAAVLPGAQGQAVMISLATEMVVRYVEVNKAGSFTPQNIQVAILVLEPFFGTNFTQIPPPAIGSTPSPAQQRLLVMIQAINLLLTQTGTTIADLVTVNPATGIMHIGEPPLLAQLIADVTTISNNLINTGVIPGTFIPPVIIPVPEPNLTDITPPSAPQNLTATSTSNSVTLSWGAATDNVGVAAYLIYRNNIFFDSVTASLLTYTNSALNPATSYLYEVKARDAAGNVSAGSTVTISTLPNPQIPTFTISGRIATSAGAGLPSVFVSIFGSGSGIVITDANGNYAFTGVRAGSYTITPAITAGFRFDPETRAVTITNANVTGMDFTAIPVDPGTVTGVITLPDGTVIITTTFPDGTVTVKTTFPNGTVSVKTTFPNGTVTVNTTFPNGTVTITTTFPDGTVTTSTTYPNGTVIGGVTYPSGTVITTTTFPNGTVTTSVTYPNGTVTVTTTYPNGTVTISTTYPNGTVIGGVTYPNGTVITTTTYPDGVVVVGVSYPAGTVIGGITAPAGTATGTVTYSDTPITTNNLP